MRIRIIDYRPPKIAQFFVLVAALLNWTTPLGEFQVYSSRVFGAILGTIGFGVMMGAWWQFKKRDTAICPLEKTDSLITSGLFRISRNPMYAGMIAMLSALAIFFGTIPFYLAALAYFLVINGVFCPYEENKLTESFGDTYSSYKNDVRRWL